ncbi:MAG TPA: glycosyltransferase family 2 protein [Terriglobales bacterium]|nr:glycosyltransferase family 2 protein [Terriglobales bacterium]
MDISIIIVNWNSIDFTRNCVSSIYAQAGPSSFEIVVVDNASSDEWESFQETFPGVKLVRSDRNLGFAGGNNLAFEFTCGDKILFLNPDTVVLDHAIERMCSGLDTFPGVGALGCKLLNADLSLQNTCIQPFPTITNQLLTMDFLKRRWPRLSLWGMQALYSHHPGALEEVEIASGACLMLKRQVFDQVGGFSRNYFMYAEEMDLCYKIRRAGWAVAYMGDAEVIHFGGQSTKKKDNGFADVVMRDSVFRFFCKFRGNGYAELYRAALFLSASARLLLLAPLTLFPARREAAQRIWRKWYRIARWTLDLERWTQQLGSVQISTTAGKS